MDTEPAPPPEANLADEVKAELDRLRARNRELVSAIYRAQCILRQELVEMEYQD